MKELKDYSTKDLQCELSKRDGVDTFIVEPYEPYNIKINDINLSDTGPVVITINYD